MNKLGLNNVEVKESLMKNGSNRLTQKKVMPLIKRIFLGFLDPMIMILLVALVVQVILFFMGQAEWFEPVGIFIAIIIANGISAISEDKQESKAMSLKQAAETREMVKVVRDGKLTEINLNDVVVGDIVYLQSGDKIPADGEVVEGEFKVDQAALNGETEEAEKHINVDNESYDIRDLVNKYYVYRGTVVCSGEGYIEIKVVGDKTLFGELALEVQEETRKTPLQIKLVKLAKQISTFGYIGATCIVLGMIGKTIFSNGVPIDIYGWIKLIINAITIAVTIIVCAVPEGLPMLTSILLSFQSLKMAKDNVLVRKINGLETAGSLNILFSDKTGTITEGKLSVVELATGNVKVFDELSGIHKKLAREIAIGIGINNGAVANDEKIIGGNSTDRALMSFIVSSKVETKLGREDVAAFNAFDSNKKCSSIVIKMDGNSITYIKGAPEKIIDRCTYYLDEEGNEKELVERNYLLSYLNAQAGRSMRLLAVAKVNGEDDTHDLTLICVLSIRDNVREEAIQSIKEVKNAGIQVVMVTGDRKETAVAIAKDAGLLSANTDVALTSAELADKNDEELKQILPNLRVVSRALPTDKSRLVRIAQELDFVVGMTGDGVNDSPALKKADVGFAMGSGTEVAKEAGDIIILDDNFLSIEKAILYGRTIFKSVRKFLIFQLTVNIAAVLICFIGPLLGENTILTVIQLLIINLAMDTLAAIAFGSEPAIKEYMCELPVPRNESIVTKNMLITILVSAIYITIICLSILFVPYIRGLFGNVSDTYLRSALFATFMMAITFNGFNARADHINPFVGIEKNINFMVVIVLILLIQLVFVTFGGRVLSVESLKLGHWIICFVFAFMVIPVGMLGKKLLVKK